MKNNKYANDQKLGAKSLLKDGLRLSRNHILLLLYQDTFSEAANCIKQVAEEMKIKVELRKFTRENFQQLASTSFSPETLSFQGVKPTGIVLLIEWSESTTKPRLNLIKEFANISDTWRVASMPGVNLKELSLCICDFAEITKFSKATFSLLARSNSAYLNTENPDKGEDILMIPLKKKYPPILSTGEIQNGSWGNFPSGETFILPDEHDAKGWVTVRGSISNYPLKKKEWIRFEIRRGRIRESSIQASTVKLKSEFSSLFFKKTGRVKCINANTFTELGIGTNPGISRLTGMPIFDEKKLGTVHIAFGKNTQFEGPLESCVHHDIVCTGSTLSLKTNFLDYKLVKEGVFSYPSIEYLSISNKFEIDNKPFKTLSRGNSNFNFVEGITPRFYVKYLTQRNQYVSFEIAHGELASLANEMVSIISKDEKGEFKDIFNSLVKRYNEDMCRTVIGSLIEFGILQ